MFISWFSPAWLVTSSSCFSIGFASSFIFRNKLWLAVGIQDKVGLRFRGQECTILHPGKGEAGAAAVGERAAAAKAAVGTAAAAAGATIV